jgi:hypothetical protein
LGGRRIGRRSNSIRPVRAHVGLTSLLGEVPKGAKAEFDAAVAGAE